jgi:hypothetical protein
MNIEHFSNLLKKHLEHNMDGMYNYYQSRLKNDNFFNEDDILIINYFENYINKNNKIIEIAAGIGQVSHYLNYYNFNNITINEHDYKRINLAKLINNKLDNNCLFINDKYQNIDLNYYDYIFTMNAVSSHMNNIIGINLLKNAINNGTKIIIKEGYFGAENDKSITELFKKEFNYDILFETNNKIYLFKK